MTVAKVWLIVPSAPAVPISKAALPECVGGLSGLLIATLPPLNVQPLPDVVSKPPLSIENCQLPAAPAAPVIAIPWRAPLSGSLMLLPTMDATVSLGMFAAFAANDGSTGPNGASTGAVLLMLTVTFCDVMPPCPSL